MEVVYNPKFEKFFEDKKFYKVLYGSAGCFDADTLIKTSGGHRKIRDIEKGELVLSYNEAYNIFEYKPVVEKYCYKSNELKQNILIFTLENEQIICTDEHKFYFEGTWTMARDIAKRAVETCGNWKREILHKQQGKVVYSRLEPNGEMEGDETIIKPTRIPASDNYDNRKKEDICEASQACCKSIYTQSEELQRSQPYRLQSCKQQCGEFGMGDKDPKCKTFSQKQNTHIRFGKPKKQINGRTSKRNKAYTPSINTQEGSRTCKGLWDIPQHTKKADLQQRSTLAARTITLEEIKKVEVCSDNIYVHDLNVLDNSNYCITNLDILVHNSGKSYAVAQKIIQRVVLEKGHSVWAFRKVSTYLDDSVFATLRQVIEDFGVGSYFKVNKTKKKLTCVNGNSITCAGLDEPEKIKSILSITIAWVEEATEFNEADINQLDLRMRGKTPHYREMIFSFNPISELHWLKRKFFDAPEEGVKDQLFKLHSTFLDNCFLDEAYKSRLINVHSHDMNNYRVYVKGEWGRVITGQEYYKNFKEETHVKVTEYQDGLPLHLTLDFNVVPYMAATVWQIQKKGNVYECHGLGELVLKHPKNSTEDMCYEFLQEYKDYLHNGVIIYGDATGRARKTSSKKTDYMIIEQIIGSRIIEIRVPRANPIPNERHTFMNRMLWGTFPIKLFVHPDMKYTRQDFTHVLEDGERRKIKEKGRDPVSKQQVEKYGHLSDGVDYFFCEAFKHLM